LRHSFFDLSTRWRRVVSFMPRPLYTQGKSPQYPLDKRLGGPECHSGCSGEDKVKVNLASLPSAVDATHWSLFCFYIHLLRQHNHETSLCIIGHHTGISQTDVVLPPAPVLDMCSKQSFILLYYFLCGMYSLE
jgi:hypothetical protein